MAEYIERRELESALNRIYGRLSGLRPDFYAGYMMAFSVMMKETRAADVAPVVHSWWTEYVASAYGGFNNGDVRWWARKFYRCERCSNGSAIRSNYCPHCGAKMGGTE